jgi:methanogenic corrinoid protein MtbC1
LRSPGLPVSFEPPLPVSVETDLERETRLAAVVADKIVPKLIELHKSVVGAEVSPELHPGKVEVSELARLAVKPEGSEALKYVLQLRDAGLTLDGLHVELLEPTARYLGELWNEDKLDFLDVSIGLNSLQRLVHIFAGLDRIPPYDERRRALIVTVPGEQHMLGNAIVQRFFRSAGWYVCFERVRHLDDLMAIVSEEWFGIAGFSLATDHNLDSLAQSIAAVREVSLNRNIGVIAGGPAFVADPGKARAAGADGTAANAPAAVILAKKLLAERLLLNVT